MSDTEKTDVSPQKEEREEDATDMAEKKDEEQVGKEDEDLKEEVEKDDKKEVEKMEEDEPVSKPEPAEPTLKKSPKKRKKVVKEEEEEEEELPLGLLERPVVIESGKREKRKVERLAMTMTFNPTQRKKVDVPEGSGAKLGDCPIIEYRISHMKAVDLKALHRIAYGNKGSVKDIKKNLKQFCGFSFSKEDKDYEKRIAMLSKLTLHDLRTILEVFDLEKSGVKDALVQRVMDFLMHPVNSGRKLPEPKKRRRSGKGEKKEKGVKRKRAEKKESKKKKKKPSKEDVESQEEEDEEEEEEDLEENDKDEDEDEDGDVDEEEESEEEAPPKKKAKSETPKKSKKDSEEKKEKKENDKKAEKKEKAAKKAEKKEPKKKKVMVSSDDDDDDSDNEALSAKKTGPPNNDELRDVVKKILDGANLEEVTMKTVVKQVYAKYPEFDLSDKKEFIKNTVKQLIS